MWRPEAQALAIRRSAHAEDQRPPVGPQRSAANLDRSGIGRIGDKRGLGAPQAVLHRNTREAEATLIATRPQQPDIRRAVAVPERTTKDMR